MATFAEAELMGCGLDELLDDRDQTKNFATWIELYAFLRSEPIDLVIEEVTQRPEIFTAFVKHVQKSFDAPEGEETEKYNHRKAKDPRERVRSPDDGRAMKEKREATDYSVLFDFVRYTRMSLEDIYRMSFRGLTALAQSLQKSPPQPSLFGA
ncbi:hypothetical protein [Deinococcus xinjiangensis]|uniref:hypothetical protein n=1 Tax=Deinococcus xinjiangensis TaxID=457454 RepID=UPI0033659797